MTWVDYKQLRNELKIEQVMSDYGVQLRGSNEQRKALCPFEPCRTGGTGQLSLSVNTAKGLWKCWRCGAHGHVIDFVALMEKLNPVDSNEFRKAAILVAEKYNITAERPDPKKPPLMRKETDPVPPRRKNTLVNLPLDFELKELDRAHPSVTALGFKAETVERFGLGFCSRRGMFQGRVAASIHNDEGKLVGYMGRFADDTKVTDKDPLYLYPEKERVRQRDSVVLVFDRSLLVYNAHRLKPPVENLIVVEDARDVWLLHDQGFPAAVTLFDSIHDEQVAVITKLVPPSGRVWFLTNAGKPLYALVHVAKVRAVRWLYSPDSKAIHLHAKEVR